MAVSTPSTIDDRDWYTAAVGAAETLLTSNGNGFYYLITESAPSSDLNIGHVVDGFTNEPVVTLAGETLYVRSRSGAITLVSTTDAGA